tara:strand:+ start:355 stop:516 length:162 start_codon:yes stop_codon:yes gene_type:complete
MIIKKTDTNNTQGIANANSTSSAVKTSLQCDKSASKTDLIFTRSFFYAENPKL